MTGKMTGSVAQSVYSQTAFIFSSVLHSEVNVVSEVTYCLQIFTVGIVLHPKIMSVFSVCFISVEHLYILKMTL